MSNTENACTISWIPHVFEDEGGPSPCFNPSEWLIKINDEWFMCEYSQELFDQLDSKEDIWIVPVKEGNRVYFSKLITWPPVFCVKNGDGTARVKYGTLQPEAEDFALSDDYECYANSIDEVMALLDDGDSANVDQFKWESNFGFRAVFVDSQLHFEPLQ